MKKNKFNINKYEKTCLELIKALLTQKKTISSDDYYSACIKSGLSDEVARGTCGAMFRKAKALGWIEQTNRFTSTAHRHQNGYRSSGIRILWKSLLYVKEVIKDGYRYTPVKLPNGRITTEVDIKQPIVIR